MKIELTMTELMLIVDMIKNGTEQDNEGDDFYLMQEFLDADLHHKCNKMQRNDGSNHQMRNENSARFRRIRFQQAASYRPD
jgi:hypothetical protein